MHPEDTSEYLKHHVTVDNHSPLYVYVLIAYLDGTSFLNLVSRPINLPQPGTNCHNDSQHYS